MKELFREFLFNEAPTYFIRSVGGLDLPEDYLEFMSRHDGGEGPIGENGYGCFYSMRDLEAVNDEYQVQEYWPGYVVIGSDMGDMLWAYNPEKEVYCQIDCCNTDEDTFFDVSGSFEEFVKKIGE